MRLSGPIVFIAALLTAAATLSGVTQGTASDTTRVATSTVAAVAQDSPARRSPGGFHPAPAEPTTATLLGIGIFSAIARRRIDRLRSMATFCRVREERPGGLRAFKKTGKNPDFCPEAAYRQSRPRLSRNDIRFS